MARKRALKQFSDEDLLQEIARRHADKHFHDGMTTSETELSVEELKVGTGEPSIALMLSRMKPEKPTAKACPKCGKRVPVKARDRERTVKSLAGMVTSKRNYHYCEKCGHGFYPVDHLLGLPEEGELSSEMEKRVLDFAVNDVYGECEARWRLHYGSARLTAPPELCASTARSRRAHRETVTNAPRARARRQHFRYARYGNRDADRCERAASN